MDTQTPLRQPVLRVTPQAGSRPTGVAKPVKQLDGWLGNRMAAMLEVESALAADIPKAADISKKRSKMAAKLPTFKWGGRRMKMSVNLQTSRAFRPT